MDSSLSLEDEGATVTFLSVVRLKMTFINEKLQSKLEVQGQVTGISVLH